MASKMRSPDKKSPVSCDTFVCLPPLTARGVIIFGKNSDRPKGEVSEIVYIPKKTYALPAKLKCTYIEVDQANETYAVILSKPCWMWGAEMGANEYGVCIGNEAVWTKIEADLDEKLLGMDLLRLGLERAKTAREAVTVITTLLQKHGQGGPCSDTVKGFCYHNSFLIADRKEAWVLETVEDFWAAEKVESRYRNISNELSIGTKIDLKSDNLEEKAAAMKLWDRKNPFHFARAFSTYFEESGSGRYFEGKKLLEKYSRNREFNLKSMMKILRDEDSGICMTCDDSFPSTSSQVSILIPNDISRPDCHWFTGTPDPMCSVYKPFVFCDNINSLTDDTRCLSDVPGTPNSDKKIDLRHALYKAQQKFYRKLENPRNDTLREKFAELENSSIEAVEKVLQNLERGDNEELDKLFDQAVAGEFNFYSNN